MTTSLPSTEPEDSNHCPDHVAVNNDNEAVQQDAHRQRHRHHNNDERSSLLLLDAPRDYSGAKETIRNVWLWSWIFSATPSAAIACLSLATARLGSVGAWQSGILYFSYTVSAVLLGATLLSKWLGSRNAMIVGMILYCVYVGCFTIATAFPHVASVAAWTGAAIGGIGAGFLWTAQGVYFAQCSEEYAMQSGNDWSQSTSKIGAIFAFCFLTEEATLDLLSTVLIEFWNVPWTHIFAVYASIAVLSTSGMTLVKNYSSTTNETYHQNASIHADSVWYKLTASIQLLISDPKMKYMIGLNASFGLASAFINSFVSGVVVPIALRDSNSRYVGLLVAFHASVAAVMSLVLGHLSQVSGSKSPAIVLGTLCFGSVALPFWCQPQLSSYTWPWLLLIYALEGTGRAMFEGPLKAMFADYFSYEKEGAYANIILQSGLSASLAYVLSFTLTCSQPSSSAYCMSYNQDGTLHDFGTFALLVIMTSIVAVLGYWRATVLYHREIAQGDTKLSVYRSESIASYRNSQNLGLQEHALLDRKTYAVLEQIILADDNHDDNLERNATELS